MKAVLNGIHAEIGAGNCSRSCSRDRCRVSLEDIPSERVVVDADKAFEAHGCGGKRCNFILFALGRDGKLVVAPSGGGMHPADRCKLNRGKIRFRGVNITVTTSRCNRPRNLAGALKILNE